MSSLTQGDVLLRHALVPLALVAEPARFGGAPAGDCLSGDLLLRAGQVVGFLAPGQALGVAVEHDLAGRLVLPRLTEAHCHLDKTHTVARVGPVGGNLQAAIEAQARDKVHWTCEDIRARAERGLTELFQAGCGAVRTHVDWDAAELEAGRTPPAWPVLADLAAEWAGRLTLQRAALLPVEAFDGSPATEAAVRQIARAEGGVLGVFVFDQPDKRRWLREAFALAARYDLPLDFHVDEGLSDGLDGLETIADLVLETGFARPVLCGHACSLINLAEPELKRTLDKVLAAGLSVVSLPTTNLYLQDRTTGTPRRRGLTRLRELAAAGVALAVGSDNVCDAFCPIGAHDPLAALATAALAAHLDPPYGPWLKAVTTEARTAIGLAPVAVDQAEAGGLLVSDARHTAELVAGAARRPLLEYPRAARS